MSRGCDGLGPHELEDEVNSKHHLLLFKPWVILIGILDFI